MTFNRCIILCGFSLVLTIAFFCSGCASGASGQSFNTSTVPTPDPTATPTLTATPNPSPTLIPTPSIYTNSAFSGSYVFSMGGINNGSALTILGSLQADGQGSITSGSVEINNQTNSVLLTNLQVTGTYNVGGDGRGSVTLNSSAGDLGFNFVLTNSGKQGDVLLSDNSFTAHGYLASQDLMAFYNAGLGGTFAFTEHGRNASSNYEAITGEFSYDSNGNLASGVEDVNNHGTITRACFINTFT